MHQPPTIISARWIVPIEPAGVVLEDHALVVQDGLILAILPRATALRNYPAAARIDRPGHVLLPGLVNAHTHAAMTLFRGLADDLPLETWLNGHIWPAEARWVTPDFVRDGAELALLEMLQGGTTTCGDMYFFPDVMARAVADSGMRAVDRHDRPGVSDGLGAVGRRVPEQGPGGARPVQGSPARFDDVRPARALYRGGPDLRADPGAGGRTGRPDPDARHWRLPRRSPASVEQYQRRPLQRLDALGIVTPLLAAVHMTQLETDEI